MSALPRRRWCRHDARRARSPARAAGGRCGRDPPLSTRMPASSPFPNHPHREVYTKVIKGQTMVRKLLRQTNKQQDEGGDYPGYVAYFTDFSPNRKTPLERDIRVSNSEEQIRELLAAMKTEYIVKGWQPVYSSFVRPRPNR